MFKPVGMNIPVDPLRVYGVGRGDIHTYAIGICSEGMCVALACRLAASSQGHI